MTIVLRYKQIYKFKGEKHDRKRKDVSRKIV